VREEARSFLLNRDDMLRYWLDVAGLELEPRDIRSMLVRNKLIVE
jgi:hypothetical protein